MENWPKYEILLKLPQSDYKRPCEYLELSKKNSSLQELSTHNLPCLDRIFDAVSFNQAETRILVAFCEFYHFVRQSISS